MSAPPLTVPIMTPRRLATLARTSPAPVPDLPVTPFLYGFAASDATVTVVWRAGLATDATERWPQEVGLCPPRPFEGIELPLSAVRRWLADRDDADQFADADGAGVPEPTESSPSPPRPVAVMRNAPTQAERFRVIDAREIRPYDVVVVPCEYGGLDEFGWTPRSKDATDIGDLRDWRGRWVIRLGPSLRRHLAEAEATNPVTVSLDLGAVRSFLAMAEPSDRRRIDASAYLTTSFDVLIGILCDEERDLTEKRTAVRQWATSVQDADAIDRGLQPVIDALRRDALHLSPADGHPSGTAAVATSTSLDRITSANLDFAEDDTPHGSSVTGARITLAVHQEDVARRARAMAEQLALPEAVVNSIEYAARWHDEGKRDPRFQAMLHGGNQFAAELAPEPLAKSGMDPADRAAFRIAWQRSKYPAGMRHEALSSQILRRQLEVFPPGDTVDDELITHLVASHHGRSRPLLPPVVDDDPQLVDREGLGTFDTSQTIDWEAPRRFAYLNERYGYWGLALCEAILRLADQNASAAPDLGAVDDDTA
jgi:CRISPR-associated endonuclease/helicase Cas3